MDLFSCIILADLCGKDVLIVEDIIDSGRTLSYLIDILKGRNPNSIHLCTLLDKPERRVKDVKVDIAASTFRMSLLSDMAWTMHRNTETFRLSVWLN